MPTAKRRIRLKKLPNTLGSLKRCCGRKAVDDKKLRAYASAKEFIVSILPT